MIGNAVPRVDKRRAGAGLRNIHIVLPVAAEEGIVDVPLCKLRHLVRRGGVARGIDGYAVGQHDQPSHADIDVVVWVVPGLHRLHRRIAEVKCPVLSLHQRLRVLDDPAIISAVFDEVNGGVIRTAMPLLILRPKAPFILQWHFPALHGLNLHIPARFDGFDDLLYIVRLALYS